MVRRLFGIEMRQYYCAAAAGWFVLGTIFLPSFPVVVSFTRFLKRQFIFILPLLPFCADFPNKNLVNYSRNLSRGELTLRGSLSGQLQVAEHGVGDVERLEEQAVLRQFLWSDRLSHLPQAEVAQPLRPRPERRHLGPNL